MKAHPILIVFLLVTLGTAILSLPGQGQSPEFSLAVGTTNVVEQPMVDHTVVQFAQPQPSTFVPAEGGEFSVPIICVTTQVMTLSVHGLTGTNVCYIQFTTNLLDPHWAPWPRADFQMSLTNEQTAFILMDQPLMFFRGSLSQ